MSIIVPAGNKCIDWMPKKVEDKRTLMKTASIVEEVSDVDIPNEDRDALYNAAKRVKDALNGTEEDVIIDDSVTVVDSPIVESVAPMLDVNRPKDVGVTTDEAGEVSIEEAIARVEDAIDVLKDTVDVTDTVDTIGEDIVIDDVKDNVEIEVDFEVSDDANETKDTKEEDEDAKDSLFVESKPESDENDENDENDEIAMDKSASTGDQFRKFSKLSPQNRTKVIDYFKNALGYPADYVALMAKDYE